MALRIMSDPVKFYFMSIGSKFYINSLHNI